MRQQPVPGPIGSQKVHICPDGSGACVNPNLRQERCHKPYWFGLNQYRNKEPHIAAMQH